MLSLLSSRTSRCRLFVGPLLLATFLLVGIGGPSAVAQSTPSAQTDTTAQETYRVEMTDGDVVIGTLVSETETEVVLQTKQLGEVTLKRSNVKSMKKIDPERIRDGQYWFKNPQSTRYLFAPNAIGIPKGEGYYQNTWILFNNVNYGISNNFSVGAGTIPIFLFGVNVVPLWVLPKLSFTLPQNNVHFAGGAVLGGVFGEENVGVGLIYGSGTVGSRDHNATLSVGYGYADGGFSDTPLFNLSGMTRISRTLYLISENYFFPAVDDGNLVSLGLRWAPRRFAVDFSLFRPLSADFDGLIAFPWLGVTIPFGR